MTERTTPPVRRVELIGHRGAAGHAPENTFAAFDRGLELSVDGLETDIRSTKDGVLVLLHDTTVDRTTDGTGAVAELTWREVRRLDAGHLVAQVRAGVRFQGGVRVEREDTTHMAAHAKVAA